MFKALMHGKLDDEFSRSPRAIEDLLTSCALGMCDYLPASQALIPFLGRATPPNGEPLARVLSGYEHAELEFWPDWRTTPHGLDRMFGAEPDVVVRLNGSGLPPLWLVVEAKLLSGKSSKPKPGPVHDQLARYWLQLKCRATREGAYPAGVVYVTAGTAYPHRDFNETQSELVLHGHQPASLYWLSWRDFVPTLTESLSGWSAGPACHRRLCEDGIRLMQDFWALDRIQIGDWPPAPMLLNLWSFRYDILWLSAPAMTQWTHTVGWKWPTIEPPRDLWQFTEGTVDE